MITETDANALLITAKEIWIDETEKARESGDYLNAREALGAYDMIKEVLGL